MPDVLPPESDRWLTIADRFRHAAWRFGYHSVRTPILEELAVFARAGEGTDVVAKEMYEFVDRDGTTVALRPGVAVRLRAGERTTWTVAERLRKVYVAG